MANGNAWNRHLDLSAKRQTVWGAAHATEFFALGLGGALVANAVFFGAGWGNGDAHRPAYALGIAAVAVGGLVLIADLGKPLRFWRTIANLRHSWISWGVVADGVFLLGACLLWLLNGPAWLGWLTGVAALYVIAYPGFALAASRAIRFWNTPLVPLEFLASGMAVAAALTAWLAPSIAVFRLAAVAFGLGVVLVGLHVVGGYLEAGVARQSARELVRDPRFGAAVLAGMAVPGAVALAASLGSPVAASVWLLAAVLAAGGNWLSKYLLLHVGYYEPFL
jgi:formate-dependent nitrite reductase membrane component NrfD